jgi:hypothetical protein
MQRPELSNLLSIKTAGKFGIAIIPEAPTGTIITPGMQVVLLVAMMDFFVNSVPESEQTVLENFLLDNFRKACELRHEQAIGYTFKA